MNAIGILHVSISFPPSSLWTGH